MYFLCLVNSGNTMNKSFSEYQNFISSWSDLYKDKEHSWNGKIT